MRRPAVTEYSYEIVHAYPHSRSAYTQGLFYLDGFLYESTGIEGYSTLRKTRLETGQVVRKISLPAPYFGEGLAHWQGGIYQLTFTSEFGFIYDLETFAERGRFRYEGEGWGLTADGNRFIMSDGTSLIRFFDPPTFTELNRICVTENGRTLASLNALQWIRGEIWANVWKTDRIVRIDPLSGCVTGSIDFAELLNPTLRTPGETEDVLNGIAYDAAADRIFVTGKMWPRLFEVKVMEKSK